MPSCLVVQHVEPECPFAIADALRATGLAVDIRRVFAGEPLPADMDDHVALVVMGGPMSAASDDGFPTRHAELRLLADALGRELPILGICLGAQLLAVAAGGSVHTGPQPEIGWGTVCLTSEAQSDPLFADAPEELTVCIGTATRTSGRRVPCTWPPMRPTRSRPFAGVPGRGSPVPPGGG